MGRTKVKVEEAPKAICQACKGKGLNPENYHELCSECEGSGKK